jgi:hypothetical protein
LTGLFDTTAAGCAYLLDVFQARAIRATHRIPHPSLRSRTANMTRDPRGFLPRATLVLMVR